MSACPYPGMRWVSRCRIRCEPLRQAKPHAFSRSRIRKHKPQRTAGIPEFTNTRLMLEISR